MSFPDIRRARHSPKANEYRFVGIDEAGRGPVIGPMVIAICALTKRDHHWCIKHGVTDSKLIPIKRREKLAKALQERCWHKTAIIQPPEIDEAVRNRNLTLNGLEIKYMANLIKQYKNTFPDSPTEIMIDAPTRNTQYLRRLVSHLSGWQNFAKLKAQNKADVQFRHVGAASIIAKSIRDTHIRKIIFELNYNIGTGYSSDKLTRNYIITAKKDNPHIRWSWATCNNLRNKNSKISKPLL